MRSSSTTRADVAGPSSAEARTTRKGRIGRMVVTSILGGLVTALMLTLFVFGGSEEPVIRRKSAAV